MVRMLSVVRGLVGLALPAVALAIVSPADAQGAKTPAKQGAKAVAGKPAAGAKKPAKQGGGSAKKPAGGSAKGKAPRQKGSAPLPPDPAARATVSGGVETSKGSRAEVDELAEVDRELFPELAPREAAPWQPDDRPRVSASGLPPQVAPAPVAAQTGRPLASSPTDVAWLQSLARPDIPFRWDPRVVRYLEFYRSSPKGRSMAASFLKKFGRYGESIRRVLRRNGLPEDIAWLAMMESAFEPRAQSGAGAAGLWQFTSKGASSYGLRMDRWVDERLDPERSTDAAARYLADLHKRFGRWELAFAAYNMGYGALLNSIRKYNTNDFWELCNLEAGLPLETALYIPKIIAIATVARNPKAFGLEGVAQDPAEPFEVAKVGTGVRLNTIASKGGVDVSEIRRLNPQLLEATTPPASQAGASAAYEVRVPVGAASKLEGLAERTAAPEHDRILVRWGESLEAIAAARGTTESKIRQLNGISSTVPLRPGTALIVPRTRGIPSDPPVVVISRPPALAPDKRHVFYEVVWGDQIADVARVLGVTPADLCRWNAIDAAAQLHGKMVLQAFVDPQRDVSDVRLMTPSEVKLLVAGSEPFFDHFEGKNGRERIKIVVKEGETFKGLAQRYGLSAGMLERINHRSRYDALHAGETLVVYAKESKVPDPKGAGEDLYASDRGGGEVRAD